MARRGQSRPRNIKEDLIYKNKLVARLINRSMKDGKKSVAEKEVYRAFELIKEDLKDDPIKVFSKASSFPPTDRTLHSGALLVQDVWASL